MWEVFDPVNGQPIFAVRFRWQARLLVWFSQWTCRTLTAPTRSLDWARAGDGWPPQSEEG